MVETLLTILDETLNEAAERMMTAQKSVEEHREVIRKRQEDVEAAEDQQKRAFHEAEQATLRANVLSEYLKQLGKHPRALVAKMRTLGKEQKEALEASHNADARVGNLRRDLRSQQERLAALERDSAEARRDWSEISGLVSPVRREVS